MLEHLRAHLTPTTPQKKVKRFFFRFFRFSFSDLHFFKIKITLDFCENSKFDFFFGQHQKNKSMFFFVFSLAKAATKVYVGSGAQGWDPFYFLPFDMCISGANFAVWKIGIRDAILWIIF